MKCLTVRQPWASLIVQGRKRVENRTWATDYRGPLLIHAGKSRAWLEDDLPLGAVVGTVELAGCVAAAELPARLRGNPDTAGPWCWLLEDPRPLPSPLPCKGRLGLWELPDDLAAAVEGASTPAPRTRVVNVRTAPAGTYLYVGRPMRRHPDPAVRAGSPFGNPFRTGPVAEVLRRYREHVLASPQLLALLPGLRGKVLGCWCCEWDGRSQPPPACHAVVLAQLADGPDGEPA